MTIGYRRHTQAKINLNAITRNYTRIKDFVKNDTLVYAVVKADAYGHGAVEVSKALSENGVDAFAVAIVDEATELRQAGLTEPILVMGLTSPKNASILANDSISAAVMSKKWLKEAKENLLNHKNPLKVHIKLDTGMGRIGARNVDEAQEILDYLAKNKDYFYLEGIFTHYATADGTDSHNLEKRQQQKNTMQSFRQHLNLTQFDQIIIWHQSNSAMTLFYPEESFDAVRPGSAIYGYDPSMGAMTLPFELEAAMTLETELVNVKQLKSGETISYGATYTASEDEWIGTLPIGYGDGWLRQYSGINVLVNGELVPIVGRICMDQCMVHLNESLPIGTTVTLIGKQGNHSISMENVAQYGKTINLESSTLIGNRVPRIFEKH